MILLNIENFTQPHKSRVTLDKHSNSQLFWLYFMKNRRYLSFSKKQLRLKRKDNLSQILIDFFFIDLQFRFDFGQTFGYFCYLRCQGKQNLFMKRICLNCINVMHEVWYFICWMNFHGYAWSDAGASRFK